jgi:hypothetical protein
VALHTVAHRWRVNRTFDVGSVLVRMACQAESERRRCDQFHPRDVFVDPDLVAGGASHRHRGMNRLALGLVFMAGDAGGSIGLRVKRDRMFRGVGAACKSEEHDETTQGLRRARDSRSRSEKFRPHFHFSFVDCLCTHLALVDASTGF